MAWKVASYPFRGLETIPPLFLRMCKSQGERVRGVGRRWLGQTQHALNHFGDGQFLGRAIPDDGLFHFTRRKFVNFQAGLRNRGQRRASRLAHDERGLQILGVEQSFDDANGRAMFFNDVAKRLGDFQETTGMFPGRGTDDGAGAGGGEVEVLTMWIANERKRVSHASGAVSKYT